MHHIVPGAFVRHPTQPDWGVGQVQPVIEERITVNFEHVGKPLINASVIDLTDVTKDLTCTGDNPDAR